MKLSNVYDAMRAMGWLIKPDTDHAYDGLLHYHKSVLDEVFENGFDKPYLELPESTVGFMIDFLEAVFKAEN